ncbi:hypothetical protein SAMN04488023_1106 [Pedobacter rhizosphaerae]|uniref:Uncharacterized protein n=1 Tax=Pedobacter rhizosphaerae TaxID=390241 RepID=A0A1H9PKC9_9SPHI|nr:hypothetical protein SAMN04488023_1106 [Pedobacter rhizosphaerae]
MKWLLRPLFTMCISFLLIVVAIGARFPTSVVFVLLAKGCWLVFVWVIMKSGSRKDRMRREYEEHWRKGTEGGGEGFSN